MISSVFEIYPTAVIWLFWARDFFCVVHRFWLTCHISKKSWTITILCNFFSYMLDFNSKSFWVSAVSDAVRSPVNILLLAWANCLSMTFSQNLSQVVLDFLQPIMSCPREKLASTPTACSIIENMLQATLERSVYFECISSCWSHQSVISGY